MSNKTIRQLLSEVSIPNKFNNADSKITNKYLYGLLTKHRSYLIKQVDSKFKLAKLNYLFQHWKCVDLVEVSAVDECCEINTKCKLFRTKKKIPNVVSTSYGPYIRRVTSVDGSNSLTQIQEDDWYRKLEDTNSKYDKNAYFFIKDDYLYFPNIDWKKVEIVAYFGDCIDEHNKCIKTTQKCQKFLDQDFRIPKELEAQLIDNVNKEILNYLQRIQPEDQEINKNEIRKGQ